MPRIRSIKPEFWSSDQVMECSTTARLLFIGLWNFADDKGRLPMKARQIKAQVFPGDDLSSDDVRELLQELSRNNLIAFYSVEGEQFLYITGWHHQRIDKPQQPKYPSPDEDHSRNDPETVSTDRMGTERIVEEGKGSEQLRDDDHPLLTADELLMPPPVGQQTPVASKWDGYAVCEFYQERRLANNHPTDANPPSPAAIQTAQRWIDAGADRTMIQRAFDATLGRHGKAPPRSLSYFDGAITDALGIKSDPLEIPGFLKRPSLTVETFLAMSREDRLNNLSAQQRKAMHAQLTDEQRAGLAGP